MSEGNARHRGRIVALLLAAGSLAAVAVACSGGDPQPWDLRQPSQRADQHLAIELRGDRLSVRLRNASWEAVLQEIEHQTGVKITVMGRLTGTSTQEFEAFTLDAGLRKLFHEANTLMFYRKEMKGGASAVTLTRLWLFPKEGSAVEERQDGVRASVSTVGATVSEAGTQAEGEPMAEEGDHEQRLKALRAFAQHGDVEALQKALFDPDEAIQAAALELLAERDPPLATAALLNATKSDQLEVRLQALQLLVGSGRVDDSTVLSALSEALADEDAHVKSYAIQALADRGGPEVIGYLRQAWRDPDAAMRRLVIESVTPLDQGLLLVQEALSDDDEAIRAIALSRLEQSASDER
jgi:HEAT repeats